MRFAAEKTIRNLHQNVETLAFCQDEVQFKRQDKLTSF